ncbi:MAG: SDR family oxidoreductase [Alphaproteobacteria bacterium]
MSDSEKNSPSSPSFPGFPSGSLMQGRRGLITGVANDRSLAWAIARALGAQGAELAFTYQVEQIAKRVIPLAASVNSDKCFCVDLTDENGVATMVETLANQWGKIDFIVHGAAWAAREDLRGRYLDTTRENFSRSLVISCHSFTSLIAAFEPHLSDSAAALTLTYYGSERVMPHYNVMGVAKAALEASVRYLAADLGKRGVRVNALSAGPVKTLAASAIGDFRYILKWNEYNAPLRRNVTHEQVGMAGLYLLSPLSSGVTGEVHHVDCGYHTVGMLAVDAADKVRDLLTELAQETDGK